MNRRFPVSWFGLLALVIMAGGSFVLGLRHLYMPELYCAPPRHETVCAGMLVWFAIGSALAMLSMAKLFDDAMRFLDSQA